MVFDKDGESCISTSPAACRLFGTLFDEVHMGHHKKIEREKELDRQRRRRKKRLKVKAKAARVKKHV